MAALGQPALTVKHADNNDFTAIVAGSEYMMGERKGFSEEQQTSAETIRYSALRIARDIIQITNLETAPVITIVGGRRQCPLGLWAAAHCDAVTSNTVRQPHLERRALVRPARWCGQEHTLERG